MAILAFIESANGEIKKASKEAVSYAFELGKIVADSEVVAVVAGSASDSAMADLGKHGASKVICPSDSTAIEGSISSIGTFLTVMMNQHNGSALVMTKSGFADNVGGRVAGEMGASIVSNVVSLPESSSSFVVKKSIYTGKAFANVRVEGDKKVILIKKSSIPLKEDGSEAPVEKVGIPDGVVAHEKITGTAVATGDLLLDDADIVVSAGLGLKGPENWGMIEELAKELGAATGCSKLVSDRGWRPHHEHVGQTGVKVSANLYIAIGISGATQHLAGVNSSKVLVAINIDPEAPFFEAADYGIVGDAFDVVPRLIKKVQSM
jgi:electron transfer flavoprotein alpha subunit